jgi:hypothetical protein
MINRLKLQLLLALFWFASVYVAMGALLSWEWAWRCAWFNLIIGMLGLLLVTRSKDGDRLFYQGPKDDEPGRWEIAVLWALPTAWLFAAGIWWLLRLVGIFSW